MTNFMSFLNEFISNELSIAINEDEGDWEALTFETDDGVILPVFSSTLKLARFFEGPQDYIELSPFAILNKVKEMNWRIGFDFGEEHQVILDEAIVQNLWQYLQDQEAIENVNMLNLVEFDPDKKTMQVLEKISGSFFASFLLQDRELGSILLLLIDKNETENEGFNEVKSALLSLEQDDLVRLLILPKDHQKWHDLKEDVLRFGSKIPKKHFTPKIPNLRT